MAIIRVTTQRKMTYSEPLLFYKIQTSCSGKGIEMETAVAFAQTILPLSDDDLRKVVADPDYLIVLDWLNRHSDDHPFVRWALDRLTQTARSMAH